jgi:uracil-DNA glycosylase
MIVTVACRRCKADKDVKAATLIDGNRDCDSWMVTLECGHMCEMTTFGGPAAKELKRLAAERKVSTNYPISEKPIPMVLHCPRCGVQHIDEATEEWDNPPHRSHACQTPDCGTIWRPADVATTGVQNIETKGKSDNWEPDL